MEKHFRKDSVGDLHGLASRVCSIFTTSDLHFYLTFIIAILSVSQALVFCYLSVRYLMYPPSSRADPVQRSWSASNNCNTRATGQ